MNPLFRPPGEKKKRSPGGQVDGLNAGSFRLAVGQNPVPLVNIKIGGKRMFIHPNMGSP